MPEIRLKEEEIQELKDSLKRCPSETFEAALKYREDNDLNQIPIIVMGIVERYLEPEMRPKLKTGDDNLLLIDDLGVDSLTMMEIIILVEETLGISFENQELREIRTIGDVKLFMDRKIRGNPEEDGVERTNLLPEEILMAMPQQPPFLFLQSAKVGETDALGSYKIQGDEFFLRGHFKDNPVFPASILLEALGQLAVLYLLKSENPELKERVKLDSIFFTSCDGIRCHKICKPGDTLEMRVKTKRLRHPLATFEGTITAKNDKVAFAEEITLTFDLTPEEKEEALNGVDHDASGANGSRLDPAETTFHQNGHSNSPFARS